jgi:hypothetical protein
LEWPNFIYLGGREPLASSLVIFTVHYICTSEKLFH